MRPFANEDLLGEAFGPMRDQVIRPRGRPRPSGLDSRQKLVDVLGEVADGKGVTRAQIARRHAAGGELRTGVLWQDKKAP